MAKKTGRSDSSGVVPAFNLWAVSGEIGLNLAIPLLILMLIGIKLDKAHQTTPLFMLAGVAFAFTISILLIYRMIKRINRQAS